MATSKAKTLSFEIKNNNNNIDKSPPLFDNGKRTEKVIVYDPNNSQENFKGAHSHHNSISKNNNSSSELKENEQKFTKKHSQEEEISKNLLILSNFSGQSGSPQLKKRSNSLKSKQLRHSNPLKSKRSSTSKDSLNSLKLNEKLTKEKLDSPTKIKLKYQGKSISEQFIGESTKISDEYPKKNYQSEYELPTFSGFNNYLQNGSNPNLNKKEEKEPIEKTEKQEKKEKKEKKEKEMKDKLLHLVEEKPVTKFKKNILGEVIYKGHPSWELMHNIQLGIRYNCGRSATVISDETMRKLSKKRLFQSPDIQEFPSNGSNFTPSHGFPDFKFKDYSPLIFRHLREKFQIFTEDFMTSLCSHSSLRELPTPGKSGSLFFFSEDMRYILKTIPKAEAKILREILPQYYKYALLNEHTLLPRFFGLHRVKAHKGNRVRMVVMGNVFWTLKNIDVRFDLKGSTLGREVSKEAPTSFKKNVTYKDNDWKRSDAKLRVPKKTRIALLDQLTKDINFLIERGLIDYSLLIGISTDITPNELEQIPSNEHSLFSSPVISSKSTQISRVTTPLNIKSPLSLREAPFETRNDSDKNNQNNNNNETNTDSFKSPETFSTLSNSSSSSSMDTAQLPNFEEEETSSISEIIKGSLGGLSILSSNNSSRSQSKAESRRQSFQTSFRLPKKFRNNGGSQFQMDQGGIRGRDKNGNEIDEWYYIGIIDILMPYTVFKFGEREYKRLLFPDLDPSSTSPKHYGKRLLAWVKENLFDEEIP